MSLRLAFAGTPEFAKTILAELLKIDSNLLAIFTQPDKPKGRGKALSPSPVKLLALEHHLPIYQPSRLNTPDILELIRNLNLDFLIVAAYGMILPKTILTLPKFGCVNVHASLLPKYRGAAPIQQAILSGESETGITIMQMDVGLDTGDIWSLYPCLISNDDTSQTLHNKLQNLGAKALIETLPKIKNREITSTPQNSSQSSYAHKFQKSDGEIHWENSAIHIERCIRAFNPWPIAYSHLANQTIRIWRGKVIESDGNQIKPGCIIACDKQGIDVATGSMVLRLLEVQLPGGKPLPVSQILLSKAELFAVGKSFTSFHHE